MSRLKKSLSACLFFAGIFLFAYPVIGHVAARNQQLAAINGYQQAMDTCPDDEKEAARKRAAAYNRMIFHSYSGEIYADAEAPITVDDYYDILNTGSIMGYLEIPKINVYLPIYHGISEDVLLKGVGHLSNSAFPIGEPDSHCLLTGHRSLPDAKIFTDLDQMETGDLFSVHILDEELLYEVDRLTIIEPDDTSFLIPEKGKDYITLMTCTPYNVNTHRLLVRGKRVLSAASTASSSDPVTDTGSSRPDTSDATIIIWLLAMMTVSGFLIHYSEKRKKRG